MSADTSALPALLTAQEAAAALRVSASTLHRMVAEGSLEPVRLRQVAGASLRFRASDVRRLVGPA